MKPTLLLNIILSFFTATLTFSQTPSNDTPTGAIALTVGSDSCSGNTAGDLTDATNSGVGGAPSCGEGLDSDVWYTAVVPTSGSLAIETFNVGSTNFDTVLTVYTKDDSDVYTEVACKDQGGFLNLSKITLRDQTAGTTLYIRVWGYQGARNPFEICAWEPSVAANDTPTTATALTVGSGTCSGNTAGDTTLATNSGVGGTPSCGAGLDSDVWYTAVVPTSGSLVIETFNVGSTNFDSVLTVYTKDDSDVYTEVACDDQGSFLLNLSKITLSDQTAGTTLYIRVWGYQGARDPFEICAWEPPPANDTPTTATALTVGSGTCSSKTDGDTTLATNSGVGGAPSCGDGLDSDVWYTAVAPTSGNLVIETFNVGSTDFDSVLTVYTKDDSDVYTEVACDDNGGVFELSKIILRDQTAGTTLYIRVWGYQGDRDPFEICAWEPGPAANDTPTTATALTVGSGTCSGNTAGDTTLATDSGVGGAPSCGEGLGSDVWYTAVAPTSGNLVIETFNVGSSDFDTVLTVYTKDDSDVYTEVACDDNGGNGDILSKVVLTDQTAGTTLYIRVWGYDGDRNPFEICAWEPSPAANDTPTTATALTVGPGTCSGNRAGDTTGATDSGVGGAPSCGEGLDSDVWYTAVIPTSGNLAIETFNVAGYDFNSVLTVYTKDDSDVYTEVACDDNGGNGDILSKVVLRDQTAGTTLYIRVWGYDGDRNPFEICAWELPPANDTPDTATPLTVASGTCSGNTAGDLTSATDSGVGGAPSCGDGLGSDVWYTAVVPTSGSLTIETFDVDVALSFNSVLTVYTKDDSDVYTEVACDDNSGFFGLLSKITLSDQTAGTTLYIRVWGYRGERNPFEICAREPSVAANDTPTTATALTVGSGTCSSKTDGDTTLATDSGVGGAPSCGEGEGLGSDVWYTAVVPTSGNLVIETFNVGSTDFDSVLTVYTKDDSDVYTEVACDDNGGVFDLSKITLSDQTAGTTLYIRVWGYQGARNPFEICAWEPPPANDTPTTATPLTVGSGTCSGNTAGDTTLATNSGVGGTPSCGDGLDSDVWYTAAVPTSGNLVIETFDVGNGMDTVLTVYTKDDSDVYTEVACDDQGGFFDLSKIVLRDQTVGTTLYIRAWGHGGQRNPFEICAREPVTPNDTPDTATVLTVGSGTCSGNSAGDTTLATNSGVGGAPSCGEGEGLGSDVWYTAVVPTSGNLAIETFNVGGTLFDSVLTVYTKDDSDVYTEVACDDNGGVFDLSKITLSDQTAGTTLYIRVWGYQGARDPFEICAWEPPPANDTPTTATALTVGSGSCSSKTAGATTSAINSGVGGTPSCGGADLGSDVWYTAAVPTSGNLVIETFNVGSTDFDSVLTVYTKDDSDVYTEVACDDNGGVFELSKITLRDQTAGTTLYIRVWGYQGDRDPFEICAWEPGPAANDTPDTATTLTVGLGTCSGNTAGDTTLATDSGVGGAPSCGEGLGSDVWYTAVVPTSGNLAIETFNVGSSDFDTVLTVYTKDDSDVYTEVACDNNGGNGDILSKVVLRDQTAGTTLYIRVWGYDGERNPFEICAWEPVTANDTPDTATALTVGSGTCSGNTAGDTAFATDSGVGGAPSCDVELGPDVWYTAVIPTSGNLVIETFNVGSTDFDSVLTVYTKDDSDVYTEVDCSDDHDGTPLSKITLRDQTAGTTLYIRILEYDGLRNPFEICAWEPPPANDTPTAATTLTVGSGTCSGNTAGDTTGATDSGVGGAPSCGEGLGSDVWYTAVVPTSGNLAIETFNVGSTDFDSVLTVYTKDDSDVYTEVACDDNDGVIALSKIVLRDQTAGTTLYIRVWGYDGDRDPFEICAWEPSPAANDTPTTATALTVGSGTCSGNTAGDTTGATNSGVGGESSCGLDLGSDVWYTVVVPTSGNLAIETFNIGDIDFDSVLTVYTKDDMDVYTEVACDDQGGFFDLSKITLRDQTAGTTLYIRVRGHDGVRNPFEICAWEPSVAVNDTPDTATPLTVGSGTCSGNTAGDTTGATSSGVGGAPSCGDGLDSDVWYTAVVPTSGSLTLETFNVAGYEFDSVLTVYTKDDSDVYTEVACDNNGGNGDFLSNIVLSDQTAGTTLYIQVWGYDGERNLFEICAWDPAPLSTSEIEVVALSVYPNPTTNILHINAQVSLEKAIVYSITGEQLLSSSLQQTPQIDVSALSTGLYLLNIIHEKGNQYIRFVKE